MASSSIPKGDICLGTSEFVAIKARDIGASSALLLQSKSPSPSCQSALCSASTSMLQYCVQHPDLMPSLHMSLIIKSNSSNPGFLESWCQQHATQMVGFFRKLQGFALQYGPPFFCISLMLRSSDLAFMAFHKDLNLKHLELRSMSSASEVFGADTEGDAGSVVVWFPLVIMSHITDEVRVSSQALDTTLLIVFLNENICYTVNFAESCCCPFF
ncbi:hypothetical protein Tco_1375988 [Tanacetum coccineum]